MRTLPLFLVLAACSGPPAEIPDVAPTVGRQDFNAAAARLALPIFQKADGSVVRLHSRLPLTGSVDEAAARVEAWVRDPVEPARLTAEEAARRQAVEAELAAGRPTLLETDLRGVTEGERDFVRHMLAAAQVAEDLFARQNRVHELRAKVDASHPASLALFERNQGPWCELSDCATLVPTPPRISGLYPADIQSDPAFCESLSESDPDVVQPFVAAVRAEDGSLTAVPYSERWPEDLARLATELRAAADALDPAAEAPLQTYLRAAADAAGSNDWYAADAAWAEMNQRNSAWYVRVGPDEVYFDPCGAHAGFHLQLARVNPDGLVWQDKLDPVKQDMEQRLAELSGPPYVAREVGFDLPEFIDVVLNAGDARSARGATIGQSLPNWGPVADAGGRTVAMTNIGVDPDSIAAKAGSMDALWCPDTRPHWPSAPDAQLLSTVLHEAGHNLGPSHEYRVEGETDTERFGGPLAAMLEELKAQTAALTLTSWLAERGIIEPVDVHAHHMGDLGWAMGQIANGMHDPAGRPRPYPQLAAIQLGELLKAGAIRWMPDAKAANGSDTGCFEVDAAALPDAIDAMAREVFRIKATGDKAAAEALRDAWTGPDGDFAALRETIRERVQRQPRPSYVYRIILDE